jgi:aminoglycoside phosphotransferase (APT) family kinase protein
LIAGLPERLAAAADCGLPDTLVHGDLHSGNARAVEGGPNVIIDWGDSFIGHPAFDILRITERLSADDAKPIIEGWADRWRSDVPGCDPETAVRLLRPVAPLRLAAVYADFLANIEPSEYVYHVDDPANCLASAVKIATAEETPEPVG